MFWNSHSIFFEKLEPISYILETEKCISGKEEENLDNH